MILYHGSTQAVTHPQILGTQKFLDFGKGFYTTTSQKQAESWAIIKQKRLGNNTNPVVSVYELNEEIFNESLFSVKTFLKANEEWLDFIIMNRSGNSTHPFDIVKGPVANDTLYATLSLFEAGILTKKETITRLKTHKLFDQISFHNQATLNELVFTKSYTL